MYERVEHVFGRNHVAADQQFSFAHRGPDRWRLLRERETHARHTRRVENWNPKETFDGRAKNAVRTRRPAGVWRGRRKNKIATTTTRAERAAAVQTTAGKARPVPTAVRARLSTMCGGLRASNRPARSTATGPRRRCRRKARARRKTIFVLYPATVVTHKP